MQRTNRRDLSRRHFLGLTAAAASGILAACGGGGGSAQPAKPSGAPSGAATPAGGAASAPAAAPTAAVSHPRVKIASVSTSWTVRMVPLVAKNKGYWDAEGLRDVEITIVGPAPTHMAALVGGSIDFSINITTDTLMRANVRGEPVYAVAGSSNKNSYALFGHSSIRSVADLRGRSLAIDAPGATIEYLTAEVLEKHGLRRGDYTLVPISGTIEERSAAAVSGAVQAALGSLSDWPALRDRGATLLAKVEDVYPDFQFAVTAARGPMLDERPATVVAFLKGLSRGFQFVQQPGNAGEILKILEDNDVSVDKTYWDEMLGLQRSIMSPDGRINRGGVEVVIQREKEAGRVPADYSMDQLVRLGPLEQAQRELGIS